MVQPNKTCPGPRASARCSRYEPERGLLQIRENEGLPSLPHHTPVLEPRCDARISVPPTPSAIARPAWPLGSAWKLARIGLAGMCEWRSTSDDVERVIVGLLLSLALRLLGSLLHCRLRLRLGLLSFLRHAALLSHIEWRFRNSAVANRSALHSEYYTTTKKAAFHLTKRVRASLNAASRRHRRTSRG